MSSNKIYLNEIKIDFSNEQDKVSYSLGAMIGKHYKQDNLDIDPDIFQAGFLDGLNKSIQISDEELDTTLMQYRQKIQEQKDSEQKVLAESNLKKSEAFLAENKKNNQNIIELPSGLQYEILTPGSLDKSPPTLQDTITVHYRGTLIDGKEFDSSYSRKSPLVIKLNQLIPGWQEALQKMSPGSKWKLYLPPKLAYGERQMSDVIGPNEALVFEIELLEVAPATPAAKPSTNNTQTSSKKSSGS